MPETDETGGGTSESTTRSHRRRWMTSDANNQDEAEWQWWAGYSEDRYSEHCADRAEAVEWIANNCEDGGWITQALPPRALRLSNYIDADHILDVAEDTTYDESDPDGDGNFHVTKEQHADLTARVRAAIDAWQDHHGLAIHGRAFRGMRDTEYVMPAAPQPQETMDE
jgi:hypothetical protein